MTKPYKDWTVLPHGPLITVNDKISTVVGQIHMPIGDFPRRMTVVRLTDRRLLIYSAVSLNEAEMEKLEALGEPTFMIVPSERHRLDAPSWKARYPHMAVVAPPGARSKVDAVVTVDSTEGAFDDSSVAYLVVPGTKATEAALEVTAGDGVTLIVNEIIGAIHDVHGLKGWLLKLMGFAGDAPDVPAPVKMQFKEGKDALAAQLRRWAAVPNLRRIIVSHGDIIEDDAKGVLTRLADSLD